MGLQTHLYALNDQMLAPGYRDDYKLDWRTQSISEANYHVPLTWLAMFRTCHLLEATVARDGGEEFRKGPIATMKEAKENLLLSAEVVEKIFPQAIPLGDYFRLMSAELDLFDFKFVTIDATQLLPELNFGNPRGTEWENALLGFENPDHVPKYPFHLDHTEKVVSYLYSLVTFQIGKQRQLHREHQNRHPWEDAINVFTAFDSTHPLPDPNFQLRGKILPTEERDHFYHLLPGDDTHQSVWESSGSDK